MKRWVAAIALLALVNCSESTAPVNLSGTWRIVFVDMTEGAFVCNIEAVDMRIVHSGGSFTGTQLGPAVRVCVQDQSTVNAAFNGETISGAIDGRTVTFALGVVPGTQDAGGNSAAGTLAGDVITGSASWLDSSGSSSLVGSFTATRLQ